MEKMNQQSSGTDWAIEEECDLCRITYSIYSNFPPMPHAQALNAETGEFFPFDRVRKMKSGYAMAEALGYAWACECRGRSQTPPQNLDNAQAFEYTPHAKNGDVVELAGSQGTPRNNQAQNRQTDDVARILRLTPGQSRQLHDEISGQGLGFHEIMERAKDMFNLW
ncbi:hypothetical protein [Paraburkholderia youngii]|uniref:hypothetical protein n=1 Tax=Paraburkholderia youngii TaxID=2782701 RepID=UPI0020CD5FD8|nr:hypothetical protein [Paraburkholderia youngii]